MTYDTSGRVIEQNELNAEDVSGTILSTTTIHYTTPTDTQVIDDLGHVTDYQFSGTNQITRITDPIGRITQQTWYGYTTSGGGYAGALATKVDPRGLTTQYLYDGNGNVTTISVGGNLTGNGGTQAATTTTATYNSLNQVVSSTNASGITTSYAYGNPSFPCSPTSITTSVGGTIVRQDLLSYETQGTLGVIPFAAGMISSRVTANGTSDQTQETFSYNANGTLQQKVVSSGTSDPNPDFTYTYTAANELQSTTDGDGRKITYTYDPESRLLSKAAYDQSADLIGSWTMTYDGLGNLLTTTGPNSGPATTTTRTYDIDSRLLSLAQTHIQSNANGSGVSASGQSVINNQYDTIGNLVQSVDPDGHATTYNYDPDGELTSSTVPGLRTETYGYSSGGDVASYTNPLGGVTSKTYNSRGQITAQQNPDGSTHAWSYYVDGRLASETLSNGSTWTTVYNDASRSVTRTLISAASAVLATDSVTYDRHGNVISHIDVDGFTTTTTYDGFGRTKSVTGPPAAGGSAQETTTFTYSAGNETTTRANALGERTTTISDILGRPVQVQTFSSGGTSIRLTNYTYVQGGNGVTMTAGSSNAIAKTVYTDALGNAVLTVLGDGSHSSNGFDLAGNLVSATDALGNTTSYSYNALNQRVSQTLPDGTVTSFSYDAAGDLLTRGMAAGTLDLVRSYDNAGRELSEQLSAGSGSTRQFSYAYYPAGNAWAGKLQSITGPTTVSSYAYDGFLRVQALTTTGAQSAANTSTTYSYDNRGLMTSASQSSTANAAGPPTQVSRTFDGYGRILTEAVSQNGTGTANITQTWDGAGRRASLNEASSSLAAPLFSYQHQADGNLVSVASAGQTYSFTYGDNGLMTERSNPYRILTVGSWDAAGRILQEVNTVSGSPVLVENLTWRANGTLSSYGAIRTGTGSWNETRNYAYNARGQLVSEGASSTASNAVTFAYTFDGNNPGMGVRTAAQELSGTLMSWQDTAAATNGFSQVTSDQLTSAPSVVPASGVALGADHVNVAVDGISQGQATFAGTNDPVGAWSINLTLAPGSHTLTASAVHPSGLYTATSSSTFTVQGTASGTSTNVFDGNGNMTSRTWTNGQVQTLIWDAFNRLIAVTLRDASNNGYNWSAIYDPLGRRLQTTQQTVTGGSPTGSPNVISSIYDPQVEFLEIGVSVNGAKAWNVYGPDLDLSYGSLQGTGGLEAIVTDAGGATVGVLSDRFGNAVATSTGSAVSWGSVPVAGYGPLPGFAPISPTSLSQLPQASVWRGRRIDPTGFYYLGARYYEPTSGRFLSADPMGQASSPSLYDFAGGDPVNRFDPDGRCPGNSKPFYGDSIPGPWGSFFQGLEEGAYSDAMAFRALPEGLGTMAGYAYQDPYGTYLGVGAYLDNTFVQGYWLAASSSFGDIPRDFSSAWDLYLNDPNSRQAVTNALAGAGTLIGLGGVQGAFSPAGNSAFNVTTDATATSPLPGSPDFIGPMPAAETTSIATPYAVEAQSASAEAQAALAQAQNGATLYRTGELGTSMAGESQYWSLQNPLSPGYANGVGMPGVQPNFIMTGTLNPGATVITNEAAGLGANAGGQIQVIVQPGGVGNLGFHMP